MENCSYRMIVMELKDSAFYTLLYLIRLGRRVKKLMKIIKKVNKNETRFNLSDPCNMLGRKD